MHGCGYHRIQNPAFWLAKSGVALANTVLGYPPLDKLREMKPDVIVCQRPRDEKEVAIVKDIRKEFGNKIKLIFEIDDLLTDVPEENVHEAFQPPPAEVDQNIAEALSYCDWAIASSKPIADWLRRLNPTIPIKIMGNFIEEADGETLPKIETRLENNKPKIGWGGSISHDGDLDLLVKSIKEISGAHWTFLGHKPRMDYAGVDFTEVPGVPPHQYFGVLASQGLELMLAPLEDNAFNQAKTNLKIVQAGLVGAAVICSPCRPYLDGKPPVFAYAETEEEFKTAIETWLALPEKKKIWHRARMRNWAKEYGVKHNLTIIRDAWGAVSQHIFDYAVRKLSNKVVVAAAEDTILIGPETKKHAIFEPDFSAATRLAIKHGAPLLIGSVGAKISDASFDKLREPLLIDSVASTCPLSNDGGMGISFLSNPSSPAFASVDPEAFALCEEICAESGLEKRYIPFPMGPIVLLSPRALAKLPPLADRIWDWGFLAMIAGYQNLFIPTAWAIGNQPSEPPSIPWLEIRGLNPLVVQGALTVMERVKLESNFVQKSPSFILGNGAGDATTWAEIYQPETEDIAKSVRVIYYREESVNIADVSETWVRFSDERTETRKGIDAIMEHFGDEAIADVVYCDAFGPKGSHFFKPKTFDFDWFLAFDYISGCCLVRTATLKQILEKAAKPHIESRLELFGYLVAMAKLKAKFTHCNYLGYYEREQPADEGRVKLVEYLLPDYKAKVREPGLLEVVKALEGTPSVSICILTSGRTWTLRQCLATLLKRTEFAGTFEILLGRMGEVKGDIMTLKECHNEKVKHIELGTEFNWSRGNNILAEKSSSDFLVFLNDDCLITEKNWLTQLIAYAQRPGTGATGLRLTYPQNGNVQHVGVYASEGIAGHILKNTPPNWAGYWGLGRVVHESTAVTGACMAVKRGLFEQIKFSEIMPVNYNDVAFCIELYKRGYRNVCICTTEMMHAESASRPHAFTAEWARSIQDLTRYYNDFIDPYWNDSLKVIRSAQNWSASGLNYDMLRWERNWKSTAIMLNGVDSDKVVELARKDIKTILAAAEKGRLVFVRPGLSNAPAIELGERTLISDVLQGLGVSEWHIVNHTPECDVLESYFNGE